MVKKIKVNIEEDIFFKKSLNEHFKFSVYINGEKLKGLINGTTILFEKQVVESDVAVLIKLDDKWNPKDKLNIFLECLMCLDLTFGNVYERLPINANYSIVHALAAEEEELLIHLKSSQVLKVNQKSLTMWKKAAVVQTTIVLILILFITFFLILLFTQGLVRYVLFIISILCISLLGRIIRKKFLEMEKLLKQLI